MMTPNTTESAQGCLLVWAQKMEMPAGIFVAPHRPDSQAAARCYA